MKYTPGIAIGAASGSVGGTTFSRNRYGVYTRTRAIPVNPNTQAQQNARSRLSTYSALWQSLTAAQRLAWKAWSGQNPITDSLGQQQILSPQVAYVGLNCRLHMAGDTAIDEPPITPAAAGLTSLTGTWDIGAGTFLASFTPTPLAANERLWCQACVVDSAGISYVANLLRNVSIEAAATATDVDLENAIEAVFGALQAGQTVHIWCSVFDDESGLLSVPMSMQGVVVST